MHLKQDNHMVYSSKHAFVTSCDQYAIAEFIVTSTYLASKVSRNLV